MFLLLQMLHNWISYNTVSCNFLASVLLSLVREMCNINYYHFFHPFHNLKYEILPDWTFYHDIINSIQSKSYDFGSFMNVNPRLIQQYFNNTLFQVMVKPLTAQQLPLL